MSEPAIAASTPTALLRRAVSWWLAQVKHALPPTIFFFIGFNLILWTKRLILQEQGIEFSGFFTAIVAALLVGKAVLVTEPALYAPLRRRANDPAHLVQDHDLLGVRPDRATGRGGHPFRRCRRRNRRFRRPLR